MHIKIPKFQLAHRGDFAPQSAQYLLSFHGVQKLNIYLYNVMIFNESNFGIIFHPTKDSHPANKKFSEYPKNVMEKTPKLQEN